MMVIKKDSDGDYKRLSGQPGFHQADFNDRDGEQYFVIVITKYCDGDY